MKERFLLAVSWGAFGWALVCLFVFASTSPQYYVRDFFSHFEPYISPAVWLVLWIVTGSPRILPWRQ